MSRLQKNWQVLPRKSPDIVKNLLRLRKIGPEQTKKFLQPDYRRDLHDPRRLKDLTKTVKRVLRARKTNERVAIFTDYDADGIPAGVLLSEALEKIGLRVRVFIPSRKQGYGFSVASAKKLKSEKISLLVCLDLGIANQKEIAFARELGIETIVIDHHLIQKKLFPKSAYAVINPKQNQDNYPFKQLCACGLVFKFVCLLARYCKQITDGQLKWWLDLVGISTVADMVPLIDENRVLAHYGLIVLSRTRRLGLASLYKQAGIRRETIDARSVSFQIAPRINAPGRLLKANPAFDLLRAKSPRYAKQLASQLGRANSRRQNLLEKMLKQARVLISRNRLRQKRVILLSHPDWHPGIVGLVAGKIAQEYQRPAFILAREGDIARGSARSPIDSFHIVKALQSIKSKLVGFGGHTRAGGLSYQSKQEEIVYKGLLRFAAKIPPKDFQPRLKIDMKLTPAQVNLSTFRAIKKLEPFGIGNPQPVFLIPGLKIEQSRAVGKGLAHLKLNLSGIKAIGFGLGARSKTAKAGKIVDVVAYLEQDSWNGVKSVQLNVIDFKTARSPKSSKQRP